MTACEKFVVLKTLPLNQRIREIIKYLKELPAIKSSTNPNEQKILRKFYETSVWFVFGYIELGGISPKFVRSKKFSENHRNEE